MPDTSSGPRRQRGPHDVSGLTRLQRELLTAALRHVRPGGVVAYVTCSPHLAETVAVLRGVLRAYPGVHQLDARELLPRLQLEDLLLGSSGIRAKLHPATEPYTDFMIRRDRRNTSVVQASGIDSPGLTSCLAVGHLVSQIVADGL